MGLFTILILAAVFDDDRIDPLLVEKMAQQQSGGACADDSYLRVHRLNQFLRNFRFGFSHRALYIQALRRPPVS